MCVICSIADYPFCYLFVEFIGKFMRQEKVIIVFELNVLALFTASLMLGLMFAIRVPNRFTV